MKRLFISLYLLLSLSLLGIGWTLDSIWQKSVDDSPVIDAPFVALAQLLTQIPEPQRQIYLDKINKDPALPLHVYATNEIALPPGETLTPNKVFTTTTDDSHQLQFIKVGDQVLVAGPQIIDPYAGLRSVLTLFFYLSLAMVAMIWVWPLSRDLRTLRHATQALGQAKWDTQIELANSSQVKPLAMTFNEMSRHISSLIENQRHLSNAVSHEIRTPLARLKFALALLPMYCKPEADSERRDQIMDDMQIDIKEMETLLQELLSYASLESSPLHNAAPCNLSEIASHTVAKLQQHQTVPIELIVDNPDIMQQGEAPMIERALQNLITNAQRFAQQQIKVHVGEDAEQRFIEVIDDGEGIPVDEQDKVFVPFYRSQSAQNGNKGHGLGLAIIKRIMQRHHGEVRLTSRAGETNFTLYWPKKD